MQREIFKKAIYYTFKQHTKCFPSYILFNKITMQDGRSLPLEVRKMAVIDFRWINQGFSMNEQQNWSSDSQASIF